MLEADACIWLGSGECGGLPSAGQIESDADPPKLGHKLQRVVLNLFGDKAALRRVLATCSERTAERFGEQIRFRQAVERIPEKVSTDSFCLPIRIATGGFDRTSGHETHLHRFVG